jgi:hypothetical protein
VSLSNRAVSLSNRAVSLAEVSVEPLTTKPQSPDVGPAPKLKCTQL